MLSRSVLRNASAILTFVAAALLAPQVQAAGSLPETRVVPTRQSFDALVQRLEKSIVDNKMGLVAQASASKGAAGRGVKIPGNIVLMVFRNDFAVRMLNASIPAGIEAPLRIYVTENADNTATVSYRTPTSVFAPYQSKELDALAKEMDPIFERIVGDAASAQ